MTRTKILHIRINDELKRALSKRAYDENRTMSNLVERMLKREIEKWKAEAETLRKQEENLVDPFWK